MQIITDFESPFESETPLAASLGFFDGLHIGHMAIISATRGLDMTRAVLTFSNSPGRFLTHSENIFRIITEAEKRRLLEKEGIDYLITLDFNEKFMAISKEDFFEKVLNHFNIKYVVAGFNFTFGKNKDGNAEELVRLAKKYGMRSRIISEIKLNGETISSTAIRNAIRSGDYKKAEAMLGRELEL